jgi:hypothetical protein
LRNMQRNVIILCRPILLRLLTREQALRACWLVSYGLDLKSRCFKWTAWKNSNGMCSLILQIKQIYGCNIWAWLIINS